MLSKVAERIYWMSRYIERTENTARLINSHTAFLLDMPESMELNWFTLVNIFDGTENFQENYEVADEINVMQFMIADRKNPSSLLSSLENMRENIRTLLDLLPEEIWEQVNHTHIQLKDELLTLGSRHRRQRVLLQVINGCQRIQGVLNNHLSRDHTFYFHLIGKHIERADMNSRILEMTSLLTSESRSEIVRRNEGILWTNLLESLGSRQMYQRTVNPKITAELVMEFLIKDTKFPRSLLYSLLSVHRYLQKLPSPESPLIQAKLAMEFVSRQDVFAMSETEISPFMDELQIKLSSLHNAIGQQWFYVDAATQSQEQS
jgi:uncharacterized alpha-E superfamily protein